MKLCIIGGGALGVQIAHIAVKCGISVVGFFDDTISNGEMVGKFHILGPISSIEECFRKEIFTHLVCAIGYKHFEFKEELFARFHDELKIPFATIINPSCIIGTVVKC